MTSLTGEVNKFKASSQGGRGAHPLHPHPRSVPDLCLRKTPAGKSSGYLNENVFKKLCIQNVFRLDGRPNSRNKTKSRFLGNHFSSIVFTLFFQVWSRKLWIELILI